jgi:NTE family protein
MPLRFCLFVLPLFAASLLSRAAADVPAPAASPTDPAPAPEAPHPRIGLVLSGGGARGAAHIGVLKALEAAHVRVDAIAGTSMGAVVGGLYASGMSAHEIEQLFESLDWQDAFRDRPNRTDLDFRRKEDDREYLVRLPLGLNHGQFEFPKGLIQGQKLSAKLRSVTLPVADISNFDDLPIPFRALATDLATGEPVVLDHGSLATAVRASLSAPGIIAPVPLDGRLLIDGGISENLPVEVARGMGADVIIAVDVGAPLQSVDKIKSALGVSNQMLAILINRATQQSRAALTRSDILITPDLAGMSSYDFKIVRSAVDAGEAAAKADNLRLAQLSVPEADYARFLARRAEIPPPPRIDFVEVAQESGRYRKLIEATLAPVVGEPANPEAIDEALRSLYGRDIFETIDYQVVDKEGLTGLDVSARPKSWGPTYLHFDLELQDDFQGNDTYSAGVRFLITDVNPFLAEWRIDLKIGDQPNFAVEFWQPLGYASPWFVAPNVGFSSRNVFVIQNDATVASYRVRETTYGLDFGRELGNWGEVRVGLRHITGSSTLRIGSPSAGTTLPPGSFNQGGFYARYSVDTLDNVNFPRYGQVLTLEWDLPRESLGADQTSEAARADWLIARSRGRNQFILSTSTGTSFSAQPGVQSYFQLGGFLNLSGLPANSIAGPQFAIARLIYLRKIGSGGEGFLDVPAYLGTSLEAGNVWMERSEVNFGSARKDASLFLGLDTPVGPLYVGSGFDQSGHTTYFLALGRPF